MHNGAKTHCPAGHPYDEHNTIRRPNGHRHCRTCVLARQRTKGAAEQRALLARPCVDCGAISYTRSETPRCRPCADRAQRVWTDEELLVALAEWAAQHAGRTPSMNEWEREPNAPARTTYARRFGSWKRAVALAGLRPRGPGEWDYPQRSHWQQRNRQTVTGGYKNVRGVFHVAP